MKKSTPFEQTGSTKIWDHKDGDKYLVTGTDRKGKKFRLIYDKWVWAQGINLWSGRKWLVRDGKRYLINRTAN